MPESTAQFTKRCRHLQGLYRESLGLEMGVGPYATSKNKHENMIVGGEVSGKNFLTPFAFEYAKQRIVNKQKNETIEEYRLFNNLLSSQPMAFNLFCPLIQLMCEGKEAIVTLIAQAIFPQIAIGKVTVVDLEYLHTDIENYLGDKTAMDAIIRYEDTQSRPCIIAIETKYTDVLGENSARHTERQKALIRQLGYFLSEAETKLLDGTKAISQIYRNFLLTESYRINEPAHEAYSVVLAPKDHPTTQQEVASLREELRVEYRYKVLDITLEQFVQKTLDVCPEEYLKPFHDFRERYLNLSNNRTISPYLMKEK